MGSRLNDRTPTDESMTLNTVEGRQLEEKTEDEEKVASPVTPTPDADEYPDGGLAAWCIVVGVSPLTISSSFRVY